jgi:hypothetical protein
VSSDVERREAEDVTPSEATLPPDPDAYDSPRGVQARARGLAAPYIAGGTDPDPETGRREERRLLVVLIVMVVVIVLSGFVLGYLALLFGFQT